MPLKYKIPDNILLELYLLKLLPIIAYIHMDSKKYESTNELRLFLILTINKSGVLIEYLQNKGILLLLILINELI